MMQKRGMFKLAFQKYSGYSMEKELEWGRTGGRESNMMAVTIPQGKRTRA